MVISQIAGGMANTLFDFMAGYSLAKKLKTEYVLDLSDRLSRSWGILLDEFDIPLLKKIIFEKDSREKGKTGSYSSVPEKIRNGDYDVYTKFKSDHSTVYQSPRSVRKKGNRDVYLSGNFFSRRYYQKDWEEIRKMCRPRNHYPEVEAFQKEIEGQENVVGIHIRRGDFQTADFTIDMGEDGAYYRAGIAWFRDHLKGCIFYVFSDGIEYAKKILGDSKDIRYIHFAGFLDADFSEFICLSLCRHFILTNESTYGELASQLNRTKGSIKLNKYRSGLWQKLRIAKWRLEGSREMLDRIYLKDAMIRYYAERYQVGTQERLSRNVISIDQLNALPAKKRLEQIAAACLDSYCLTKEDYNRFAYIMFLANAELNRVDVTLNLGKLFYSKNRYNRKFIDPYIKALKSLGAYQEANIEEKRLTCDRPEVCFLIVPYCKTRLCDEGMVGLGLVLFHMGFEVSFLLQPNIKSDRWLMDHYEFARDWHELEYPCRWYVADENCKDTYIIQTFFDDLYEEENSSSEKMKVCISRRKETFIQTEGWTHIYYDFSDKNDEEFDAANQRLSKSDQKEMEEIADYILTCDESKKSNKSIFWKNDFPDEKVITERWTLGMNGRLPEKEMRIAECIVETIV